MFLESMKRGGAMPMRSTKVIPIRRQALPFDAGLDVVDLAYERWLARGFRGGSPEQDLLAAVRDVKGEAARPFLVSKRDQSRE